jgi:hypothetical protein
LKSIELVRKSLPSPAHFNSAARCLFGPEATRPYRPTAVETGPNPWLLSLHTRAPSAGQQRPRRADQVADWPPPTVSPPTCAPSPAYPCEASTKEKTHFASLPLANAISQCRTEPLLLRRPSAGCCRRQAAAPRAPEQLRHGSHIVLKHQPRWHVDEASELPPHPPRPPHRRAPPPATARSNHRLR